jgi:hypothetical protein
MQKNETPNCLTAACQSKQKKYLIAKRWFHREPNDNRNLFFQWSIYLLNANTDAYEYACGTTIQNYKEAKEELLKEL